MTYGQDYDQWGQIPRQYDPALHDQRLMGQLPASPEEVQPWLPPQPVYASDEPERRAGTSWPGRHKVLTAFGSLVAIGVIATAATSRPSKPPAPVPAAAVATASSCATQTQNWFSDGAGQLIGTFSSDFSAYSAAGENFVTDLQAGNPTASDVSAVQSAAAAIQSDAQELAADPGPSCVRGLDPAITAAARDYSEAAIDVDNGMDQYSSGSMNAATADIDAGSTAMSKGNAQIAAATAAVDRIHP